LGRSGARAAGWAAGSFFRGEQAIGARLPRLYVKEQVLILRHYCIIVGDYKKNVIG
jgi:hypothetical protein